MGSLSREELRLKHLEMIQSIVTRLAGNSFSIKGWTLTITAAIFALATNDSSMRYVRIAVIPVFFFWGLDAYYLRQERLFRALYDRVRKSASWFGANADESGKAQNSSEIEPFSMDIRELSVDSWGRTWRAGTLAGFYAPLLAVVLGFCIYGYLKPKTDLEPTRLATLAKIADSASALSKNPAPDAMARALDRLAGAVERMTDHPSTTPAAVLPSGALLAPVNSPSRKGTPAKNRTAPRNSKAP